MDNLERHLLQSIFGGELDGKTPEDFARNSTRMFVRSQDELTFDRPQATGLRLSAQQALQIYGLKKLTEILDYGSAVIVINHQEPARTFKKRREELGLSHDEVARLAGVTPEDVAHAEDRNKRNDIHVLVKIATAVGLDPLKLGWIPGALQGA